MVTLVGLGLTFLVWYRVDDLNDLTGMLGFATIMALNFFHILWRKADKKASEVSPD